MERPAVELVSLPRPAKYDSRDNSDFFALEAKGPGLAVGTPLPSLLAPGEKASLFAGRDQAPPYTSLPLFWTAESISSNPVSFDEQLADFSQHRHSSSIHSAASTSSNGQHSRYSSGVSFEDSGTSGPHRQTVLTRLAPADQTPYSFLPFDLSAPAPLMGSGETLDSEMSEVMSATGVHSQQIWNRVDSEPSQASEDSAAVITRGFRASSLSTSQSLQEYRSEKAEVVHRAIDAAATVLQNATTTAATVKARSTFVQTWLTTTYEPKKGHNLCRQALYRCQVRAFANYGVNPLNPAAFGKAVRQAFPKLKTRRLGTRGHSRYHYIDLAPTTPTEAFEPERSEEEFSSEEGHRSGGDKSTSEDVTPITLRAAPSRPNCFSGNIEFVFPRPAAFSPIKARRNYSQSLSISVPSGISFKDASKTINNESGVPTVTRFPSPATARPLGLQRAEDALPTSFPRIEEVFGDVEGCAEVREAGRLWSEYAQHCWSMLSAARILRYDLIEPSIQNWWGNRTAADALLAQVPALRELFFRAQAVVYTEILGGLHSSLLSLLPHEAVPSLRRLASRLAGVQIGALAAFADPAFTVPMLALTARFTHVLSIHLGMRYMAQALRASLPRPGSHQQLAQSWNELDFGTIKNHAALAGCEPDFLDSAFKDLSALLESPCFTLDGLLNWFDSRLDGWTAREPAPGSLLLKASIVASQIMRDLTLRSPPALDTFQLLKIFCEDLLSFQILRHTTLEVYALSSFVEPSPPIPPPQPPSPGLFPQRSQRLPPSCAAPRALRLHPNPSTFASESSPSHRPPGRFSPSTRQLLETDYHYACEAPAPAPEPDFDPAPSPLCAMPGPGGEAPDPQEGPFVDVHQAGLGPTGDRAPGGARGNTSWFGRGAVSW